MQGRAAGTTNPRPLVSPLAPPLVFADRASFWPFLGDQSAAGRAAGPADTQPPDPTNGDPNMTSPADLASLDWLDLIDPQQLPPGYRDALAAERDAVARRQALEQHQAGLEAQLARDWQTAPDPLLHLGIGAELAAVQQIFRRLPDVPVVPDSTHEQVAERIAAGLALPALQPSLYCAEMAHHLQRHRDSVPPVTSQTDLDVVELLERTSRDLATASRQVAAFKAPLNGSSLADRVRALSEYRHDTFGPLVAAVEALAATVRTVDAARITEGRAHHCRLLGGDLVALPPVAAGTVWTLAGAMRGEPGPAVPAAGRYDHVAVPA